MNCESENGEQSLPTIQHEYTAGSSSVVGSVSWVSCTHQGYGKLRLQVEW